MTKKILYYSTNRNLPNGFKKKLTFKEALFLGLAPDKGLFMPDSIPKLSKKEISSLKNKKYNEIAYIILKKFLNNEIKDKELKKITKQAYNFNVPIEKIDNKTYLVRLDQGPTASFKDFAARLMARLMYYYKEKDKHLTVFVATSGDTGGAVGEAYRGLKDIKVYILYPKNEVSIIQKQQLDSIGDNVNALEINTKFDRCQILAKKALADKELKKLNLTSANSINIGRVLPQIVYYFYAYSKIAKDNEKIIFSIPSGNFGNSLGCELARKMGLPVKLIIAVNENDEFPKFLKTGKYKKIAPSKACLSNAMNVGNPSNLSRYFDLYNGTLDKEGIVHKKPNLKDMRKNIYSESITDKETIQTIKKIYKKYKIILEPHGAVGVKALEKTKTKLKAICIETAAPGKFPEVIKKELSLNLKIPKKLKEIIDRKGKPIAIENNYNKLKDFLIEDADK